MIKIEDYIMDEDMQDVYGEGDLYLPDSFAEYFTHRGLIDEVYKTIKHLLPKSMFVVSESLPTKSDADKFPSMPENPKQGSSTTLKGDESWGGSIGKHEMEPISREKLLFGNRLIKALMQVPHASASGLLGRTLLGNDPAAERYIGSGFFGALRHRAKTGDLGDYTVEMRFLKPGQPKIYIYDPVTLTPIPNMGAVVAPSRAATLNIARDNQIEKAVPSANPHPGYLYDGLSDPDANGKQVKLSNAKDGQVAGHGRGVFVGYKSTVGDLETAIGAPRRQYATNKRGQVGTSLAPPDIFDPDTYLGQTSDEGEELPAGAIGFKPTATSSTDRRKQGVIDPLDDLNRDRHVKRTGGSGTFDKALRKWIQALAEHPGWFNQRVLRYLTHRQRAFYTGEPTYADLGGNPVQRTPTSLVTYDPGETPPGPMTHAAPINPDTGTPGRRRGVPVPQDPRRRWVEPAVRVPLTPQRAQKFAAHLSSAPNLSPEELERQYQQAVASQDYELANQLQSQLAHVHHLDRMYTDPKWIQERMDVARASNDLESYRYYNSWLRSATAYQRLQSRYSTAHEPVNPRIVPKPINFGRSWAKDTDSPQKVSVRRSERTKEIDRYPPKYEIVKDSKGNEKRVKVRMKHELPALRRVIPNLFTLIPAPGEPILISEELAQELMSAKDKNASMHALRMGDDSLSDRCVRMNHGKRVYTGEDSEEGKKKSQVTLFTVGQKVGNRYTVRPVSEPHKNKDCIFAKVDANNEVLFIYTKTKEDRSLKEQPILSPGIINSFMDNNPVALGGIDTAPQGEEERMPHQDQEAHSTALYGPRDPKTGEFNKGRTINPDTKEQRTREELKKMARDQNLPGMEIPIMNAVWSGVVQYIYKYVPPEMRKRFFDRQQEFLSYAAIYAYYNLKNGKMLDFEGNGDGYFNLRYMHQQFPHLYAIMKQLDQLVRDGVFEGIIGTNKLPSKMTLEEFRSFLNNKEVKALLDEPMAETGETPVSVKIRTDKITYKNPQGERRYLPIYAKNVVYQRTNTGHQASSDELSNPNVRKGYTRVGVGTKQIWALVSDARNQYLKWIGKDMVRKIYWTEDIAKNGRKTRGGVFADSDLGMANVSNDAKLAARIEQERGTGSGYSKWRGRLSHIIEQKRIAPAKIKREYLAMKAEFENHPNLDLAAKLFSLSTALEDAIIQKKAYDTLTVHLKMGHPVNPDTGEEWNDINTQTYILKHLPNEIERIKQRKENEEGYNEKHLSAASVKQPANAQTPEMILRSLADGAGEMVKSRELEEYGYNLVAMESEEDTREALRHITQLHQDIQNDLDADESLGQLMAIEYHAGKNLIEGIKDNTYSREQLENFNRSVMVYLSKARIAESFVFLAKLAIHDALYGEQ